MRALRFIRKVYVLILNKLYYYLATRTLKSRPKNLFIGGYVRFNQNTVLDEYCNFNGCKIYGAGSVFIGRYFHSGPNLKILTTNHNYNGSLLPYGLKSEDIIKSVRIGSNVWIGQDVTILPGVTIGEGCIIQAGSIVSQSLPDLSIAGGNPCKAFRCRDIDHFNRLKKINAQIDLC